MELEGRVPQPLFELAALEVVYLDHAGVDLVIPAVERKPAFPALPGLAIESEYRPAREVGSDFFQIFGQEDGINVIFITRTTA